MTVASWGVACCPRCEGDVPLVSTIAFTKAEFYCLDCGGTFGFLDPRKAQNPGPELDARMAAYEAEWAENAGRKLLTIHSWHTDCEACKVGGEYHHSHATEAEHQADAEARAWLTARVRVTT